MNEYECSTLELVMRYLDVAAHLLLEEMDGVPGIHNARRSLATAEGEVAKAHQAQTEGQAVVQSASTEVMWIGSRLKTNARSVSERKAGATEARERLAKGGGVECVDRCTAKCLLSFYAAEQPMLAQIE